MATVAARGAIPLSGSRRRHAAVGLCLLLVALSACRNADTSTDLRIAALDANGAPIAAAPRSGPQATAAPPTPPALTVQPFRPRDGYTSFAADRRGVYWLGGGVQLAAAVVVAGPNGEQERVIARPGTGEAVGRPLPAGEWIVFPQTRATSAAGGPWRLRAVNLADGRDLEVDASPDGWEGLSHAVSGTRVAYTVTPVVGAETYSEVRVWDSADDSRRVALRTPVGVTLQRIAYDGSSAAAVRTTRRADGSVATDVVELDLVGGTVISLDAPNATLPAISPRWIAWVTMPPAGGGNQLVVYDRQARSRRTAVESGPGRSLFIPSITGNLITWNASDTSEVAVYDAAQRAVFPLDSGSVGKVWAQDGVIIWTALNAATRQYELKIATLAAPP